MDTTDDRRHQNREEQRSMTTDENANNAITAVSVIEEQAEASIRRVWLEDRWFFSVIDVIGVLTDSETPNKYWTDMRRRIQDEGFAQLAAKCRRFKLRAVDGKLRETDVADTETILRIIQSVPSPKAEPVKQWLARVGAKRLEEATRPLEAAQANTAIAAVTKPAPDAPAALWADYHEQLMVLYRRQAAYEAQLAYVDAKLEEHEEQIGELHSRMESLEEGQRLLPELLARLGQQTLTSEHQATVKAMAGRLHDLAGYGFSTIYGELNAAFHVGKYSDLPEGAWEQIAAWFQQRIDAAQRRPKSAR
jgi:BRO family, N-terminal domain/ORF6C domain